MAGTRVAQWQRLQPLQRQANTQNARCGRFHSRRHSSVTSFRPVQQTDVSFP